MYTEFLCELTKKKCPKIDSGENCLTPDMVKSIELENSDG